MLYVLQLCVFQGLLSLLLILVISWLRILHIKINDVAVFFSLVNKIITTTTHYMGKFLNILNCFTVWKILFLPWEDFTICSVFRVRAIKKTLQILKKSEI